MTEKVSLWPCGVKIPCLGITGPFGSGKTTFGISIAPHSTLCFDLEKSSIGAEEIGVTRVDMADLLLAKYPRGAKPKEMFELWLHLMREVPGGKYDVIMIDPADRLEIGLVDWMKSRHAEYGFKSPESFVATKGIFQSYVNDQWERLLLEVTSRCQTFVFCNHQKKEWDDQLGKSTDKVVARGRSAFYQLAGLYLTLEKDANPDGAPAAVVDKSRLVKRSVQDGVVINQPILPQRMPVADPKHLREYIVTPADLLNPAPGEKAEKKQMSEDDKLEYQARIAANQRAAAEANVEIAKMEASVEDAKRIAKARAAERTTQSPPVKTEATQETTVTPITSDEATSFEKSTKDAGIEERVRKGVLETLKKRGISVNEDSLLYPLVMQLTRDEYKKFINGILMFQKKS